MIAILSLLLAARAAAASPGAQLQFLNAQMLERSGAFQEALKGYEKAIEQDPTSAYLRREAAALALEMGEIEKALGFALKAAELDGHSAESLVVQGRVQAAAGDFAGAEMSLQAALKKDPASVDAVFSLAGLLAGRDPAESRKVLERFLEQNPEEAGDAHFQIARLDLQQGKIKQAQERLKKAIALDADNEALPARYALAESYEAERSTDAAIAEYKKILKLEPQNPGLMDRIAQLHMIKGETELAKRQWLDAKTAQPDDPSANHWLSQFAEKAGDWEGAAKYIRESAAFGEEPALSLRLGYHLTQANKLPEAVKVLEDAKVKWPQNDQILYFLALGYDDMKQPEKAMELLKSVTALKPEFRDARFQLGVIYERLGKMAEAEAEFRRLLETKPDDASALNYLGYSLADRGLKLDEAEAVIKRAVALDPRNPAYLDSLGWVRFKQGRFKEAVADLEAAMKALPEDETILDHVGEARAASGDLAGAWRVWKRGAPKKAADAEGKFSPEELGVMYLGYLDALQGGLRKATGLCELSGEILGTKFSYTCMLSYAGDALSIELLGPLFTPMFKLSVDGDAFVMDELALQGLDPAVVRETARRSLALMRDYFSGKPLAEGEARFVKGWRRRSIDRPQWDLGLDAASAHLTSMALKSDPDFKLCLDGFGRTENRDVPRRLAVTGKGFELGLRLDNVKLEFLKR